jgi:hypothetical protein
VARLSRAAKSLAGLETRPTQFLLSPAKNFCAWLQKADGIGQFHIIGDKLFA